MTTTRVDDDDDSLDDDARAVVPQLSRALMFGSHDELLNLTGGQID